MTELNHSFGVEGLQCSTTRTKSDQILAVEWTDSRKIFSLQNLAPIYGHRQARYRLRVAMALPCSYSLLVPYNRLGVVGQSAPPSQLNDFCGFGRIQLRSIPLNVSRPRRDGKIGESIRAEAVATEIVGDYGEPISLGTVKLPSDVNLKRLEGYLYQWGSGLTQNANLPLPAPIKVDKIDGGLRIGYIKVTNGAVEDLVHIDCLVSPATSGSDAMFRAVRSGRLKDLVPPGERIIMQSLLQALRKSIELSKM